MKGDVLRIKLPVKVASRVRWTAAANDISVPDLLRALFFIHLYGFAAYGAFLQYGSKRQRERAIEEEREVERTAEADAANDLSRALFSVGNVKFSTSRSSMNWPPALEDEVSPAVLRARQRQQQARVAMHGPIDDEVEGELPDLMRADLAACAVKSGKALTVYARNVLIAQMFGERIAGAWDQYAGI